MNTQDKLKALKRIQVELWALLTEDEQHDYPVMDHLSDLIDDLTDD